MRNTLSKKKSIIYSILFVVSIVYLFLYMKPSLTDFDENYTLTLIRHNFRNIIYYDSLDVHPPLYYILLKLFINLTTFWTSYFPIKIFFARLFSLLLSIVTFVFLRKITVMLNISNKWYIQWILLLLLPNVLGPKYIFQQFINIRMYSLAALLIVIQFFYLIKFEKSNSNGSLIIATLCAVLACYTHYYAAIFSGLLLLCYFIKYLMCHNYLISLKIVASGLSVILLFLPWGFVLIRQISNPNTYWLTGKMEIMEVGMFIPLILLFIYPIYKYMNLKRNKLFNTQITILLIVIVLTFLFSIIYMFCKNPIFQCRYMYPILIIYEFIGVNIIFKYHKKFSKYTISLIILLICIALFSMLIQVDEDYYSINSIQTYNSWEKECKTIHITSPNYKYDTNYSSYIPLSHNRFIIYKKALPVFKKYKDNDLYKKLFHNTLKNMRFK